MIFSEKLQLLRKNKGLTQEELAGKLNVSRQAVEKWEAGQVYPDISNLIQICNLFHITLDYLVRDQECTISIAYDTKTDLENLKLISTHMPHQLMKHHQRDLILMIFSTQVEITSIMIHM